MAKLLINDDWYDEIAPTALYETEFEQIVIAKADLLYPEYRAVPFKKIVFSEVSSAKPDLALIDVHYRDWWVVEIEMGHHDLASHVLPQVRTLSEAKYGEEEAT